MSIAVRFPAAVKSSVSLLSTSLLLLASAAWSVPAGAQTAPTLIPYTVSLVAGGGVQAITAGSTCPVSGYTATDNYGDGCLATEIQLGTTTAGSGPRYAIADKSGAIFFSDYANGLIRRIDPSTGIVTAVGGGAKTSPAAGTACGTAVSTDAKGDGCPANLVNLYRPTGLAFAPNGDLYFAEYGNSDVRKISATNGLITTTGTISLVAGNANSTYGYAANNGSTLINAATQSYLDAPFGLAFDSAGNLYIAEEYKNAILVVNTNATGSTTVTGVSIPAGTIAKIVGAPSSGGSVCPNSPATTNGCNYGNYTSGASANSSETDSPYGVTFDPSGNVYFADEYDNNVGRVDATTGILTSYAGAYPLTGTGAKTLQRGKPGFAIGSDFGVAADTSGDVYITDALNGVVWRVDTGGATMYPVAGGAKTVCSGATDANGDGCPALEATFGSSGTTYAASGTSGNAGIFGITVDAYSDLFVGDTVTNEIREIASGTQFGNVGANQPTQTVEIHFAAGDSPAANAYSLTAGASNFALGSATCTTNSDTTVDCLLPITATPTALGSFTGTLTVNSTLGATAAFPLSGTYVQTPETRTSVTVTNPNGGSCGSTTTYGTTTPLTITANIASSGNPTGTVTFYANGTQIGTPQTVSNSSATLTYTFSTAGTYTITATYSGDSYFTTSTGKAPTTVTSSAPGFTAAVVSSQASTVVAGQTALYSFSLTQNVYSGTITFACSGLPANSSCSFSPPSISANGCSTSNTVALSILTQAATIKQSGLGLFGRGPWTWLGVFPCVLLALLLGMRRRGFGGQLGRHLWLMLALLIVSSSLVACGKGVTGPPATPSGNYTITVTATGSAGSPQSFTIPLTVH